MALSCSGNLIELAVYDHNLAMWPIYFNGEGAPLLCSSPLCSALITEHIVSMEEGRPIESVSVGFDKRLRWCRYTVSIGKQTLASTMQQ